VERRVLSDGVAGVGGQMPRNEVLIAEDGVLWDDVAGVGGLKVGL